MKLFHQFVALAVIVLSIAGFTAIGGNAIAQDADPLAGSVGIPLNTITPMKSPDSALTLLHFTMPAGAVINVHHHPGPVILYVESGVFTTTFTEGAATISRTPVDGAAASETVMIGAENTLNAGDSVIYDEDTHHIMENRGTEPLVLLASLLFDPAQPGFIFDDMGTPAS